MAAKRAPRKRPAPQKDATRNGHGRPTRIKPAVPNGQSEEASLPCVSAEEIVSVKRQWLSQGRFPLGAFWLLDGNKGTGKSSIAASVAAAVTGGPPLPGGRRRIWGNVIWCAGEEDLADVRGKLLAAGANLGRVFFPGRGRGGEVQSMIAIPQQEELLEATLRRTGAKLMVLDTLSCFAGSADLNQEQPARTVTSPLTRIAQETGALIFGLRHPRKTPVANPLDRGMGNPAIGAAARGVLTTGKDPDSGRSVLGLLTTNLGRPAATIVFSLVDSGGFPLVQWGPEIALPADRIEFGVVDEGVELQRIDAKVLLQKRIGGAWVAAADVLLEARRNGISQDALDRARWKLGVRSRRVGKLGSDGHWEYGPPADGWPAGE